MGSYKAFFLVIFFLIIGCVFVGASFLPEIDVDSSVNFKNSSLEVFTSIGNNGGATFYDLFAEIIFDGEIYPEERIDSLKSKQTESFSRKIVISEKKKGVFPVFVKARFYNSDGVHFSSIGYDYAVFGEMVSSEVNAEINARVLFSDGVWRVLLRNNGDSDKRVLLNGFFPEGVNAKFSNEVFVEGNSEMSAPMEVSVPEGLESGRYEFFVSAEYDENGRHFSDVAEGNLVVERRKSNVPVYFSVILSFAGVIAVFFFGKKLRGKREFFVDACVLVMIVLFLFFYFEPSYLVKTTTISGGDTSSHNFMAKEMKEKFLPSGKVFGWSNGWWNGFPMFQFYFFFPYLLMALMSFVMPLQIAFRIVSVLGIFSLPLCVYFSLRLMRFKFPMPILGAIASLFLLFGDTHTMWGVNIYSTLAGEISQSISFSLMVLFFGLLYRGIEENKHRVLLAILFSLVVLTHLTTAIIAIFAGGFFLIETDWRKFLRRVKFLAFVFGTAFLLTAFWTMPMVLKMKFATGFGENWDVNLLKSFPSETVFFAVMMLLGFFFCVKEKDKRFFYIAIPLLAGLILWKFAFFINLVDIRFWPFLHYGILIAGAYGIFSAVSWISSRKKFWFFAIVFAILFMIFAMLWIEHNPRNVVHEWVKWNYEGYEEKIHWKDLKELMDFFDGKDYTDGRVASTMNSRHNIFGSPRVFELIPFFTKMPYIEGAIEQSSVSSPFGRFVQCKTSRECAGFPRDVKVQEYNIKDATKYFKLFNVRYFISESDETFNELRNDSEWKIAKTVGAYRIYELQRDSHYVSVPKFEPIFVDSKKWRELSLEWFYDADNLDVPIVFDDSSNDGISEEKIVPDMKNGNLRKLSRRITNDCDIKESILDDEILFETSCIGLPHLVKFSYSPNWRVEGTERIFPASPGFMVVFPTESKVRIYYGTHFSEVLGIVMSVFGLVTLGLRFWYERGVKDVLG